MKPDFSFQNHQFNSKTLHDYLLKITNFLKSAPSDCVIYNKNKLILLGLENKDGKLTLYLHTHLANKSQKITLMASKSKNNAGLQHH